MSLNAIGSLKFFDLVYNMIPEGFLGNRAHVLATHLYDQAFKFNKLGYGCAIGVVLLIMCLIVTFLINKFVKVDNLSYKEVKQCLQSLVFGLNTPSRWGSQAPFSNFTMDWDVPDDLAELNCIVGGKELDFKYKDCKREMDMINKAFMELMIEGDANGRGFQYPIPTYSITKDFDWDEDSPNNKLLFEMAAKYGIPYFSNYINL